MKILKSIKNSWSKKAEKIHPMLKKFFLLILLYQSVLPSYAQQQKKRIDAGLCTDQIKTDGVLNEISWQNAQSATSFIQRKPYNGSFSVYSTEVKLIYDNSAVYIGAMMYDPHPDSIPMQLGLRDAQNLNADYFMAVISPYNNGVDAFCFKVYSSDVQVDYKMPDADPDAYGDVSWDAVWESKVRKNEKGWVAEIKIPYSAIRFSYAEHQVWGINYQRDIRRYRESSTWNFVDSKVQGYVNQEGLLGNIHNIKPPLRLSLTPYVSGYLEKNPENKNPQLSYNYGTDLKYGINQSFTLDMTLIPDFGQVPSDDKVYNFSPYEIRYDEKRQFFTEGTELFNKGGIFYSRRIGKQPMDYDKVALSLIRDEKITKNPMQAKLINASKISGRTNKGLGIGFFNAISGNTWAVIEDTVTGIKRRYLTQGVTNYNMIVFDQAMMNSSYLDFLNTNYYMPGNGYCANVTGTNFSFNNKKYTYGISGNGFISQKYNPHSTADFGYHYNLTFAKISGNFQFKLTQLLETDRYDPNDIGYNDRNNKFDNSCTFSYNIYQPFGRFLNSYNGIYFIYRALYEGLKYSNFEIHTSNYFTTRKYLTIGVESNLIPVRWNDYFEPRVSGWMYIRPTAYSFSGMISSDYRKVFALDLDGVYVFTGYPNSNEYHITIVPRVRASNRLFFTYHLGYQSIRNARGYITDSLDLNGNQHILFGKRDVQVMDNILTTNYMFSSTISLDIRIRHYWVTARYKEFYSLNPDGTLSAVFWNANKDFNYNLFDLYFTLLWNFAPGSQLSFVWKNAVYTNSSVPLNDFFTDFSYTMNSPATNSFSIRFLYYLDAAWFLKKHRINPETGT
jgi:hypothetical protein